MISGRVPLTLTKIPTGNDVAILATSVTSLFMRPGIEYVIMVAFVEYAELIASKTSSSRVTLFSL
jgi:hypothetical protein